MRAAMTAIFSRALPVKTSLRNNAILLAGALLLPSALSAAFVSPASAQDTLRGSYVTSPQYYQWDGFYGGAQIGYSNIDANFGKATQPLTDYILRNSDILDNISGWTTLQKGSTNGSDYGGFIGYNWQWDDVVIGLEANYSRSSLTKSASDSLSRRFIDNTTAPPDHSYMYNMTVAGGSSVKLTDLATFRARAGWAVGSLLPYGFIGFAVARADVTTNATVSGSRTDTYTPPCPDPTIPGGCPLPSSTTANLALPGTQTTSRKGVFTYGGSIGLGFDWALSQNLFVRGEWELVQLQEIEGINLRINTARAAVGVKF